MNLLMSVKISYKSDRIANVVRRPQKRLSAFQADLRPDLFRTVRASSLRMIELLIYTALSRTDGRTAGRTDGRTDGQNGRTDRPGRRTDEPDGRTDGRTDGRWTNGRTDRRTDG